MDETEIAEAMAEREMLVGELRMMEEAAERGEAERASRQAMVHDLERMAEAQDGDGADGAAEVIDDAGGGVDDGAAIAEIMEAMAERQRLMSELDAMSAEKARLEQHMSQKREMAAAPRGEPQLPPQIMEAMAEHQRLLSEMSSMEAEHAHLSARREAEEGASETQDTEVDEKRAAMAEAMMLMSELEDLQRIQRAQGASRGAVDSGRVEAVPEAEPEVEELRRDRGDGQEANAMGGMGGLRGGASAGSRRWAGGERDGRTLGQLLGSIGGVAPHRLAEEGLRERGGAARALEEEEEGGMNSETLAEMESLMAELNSLAAEKEQLTRQSRELAAGQESRRGGAPSAEPSSGSAGGGGKLSPQQRNAMLAELAVLQAEQQRLQASPSFPRAPLDSDASPSSSSGGAVPQARRALEGFESLQGEEATADRVEELRRVEAESQAAMAEREMLMSELASLEAEQAQRAAGRLGRGGPATGALDALSQFAGGQLPPEIVAALAMQQKLVGEMKSMEAEREAWHRARTEEDAARARGASTGSADRPAAGGHAPGGGAAESFAHASVSRAQKERDLAEARRERATLVSELEAMEAEQVQLRAVQERAMRASLALQGEYKAEHGRGGSGSGAAAELAQVTRLLSQMQRGGPGAAEVSEADGLIMELQALRAEQRELALLEERASPQRAVERGRFEREERAAIVEQQRLYGEVRAAEEEKAATLRVHAAISPFRKRAENEAIATETRERMLARLAELEGMRDQYRHLEQAAQVRELARAAPAPAPQDAKAMSPSRRLAVGVEDTLNVRVVSEEIAAFREQQRSVVERSFPVTELCRELAAFREQQQRSASETVGALPAPPARAHRAEGERDQLTLELAQLQREQSVLHAQSFQLQNAKSRGPHGGAHGDVHGGPSAGVMDEEALLLEEQRQLLMQMESFNSERALIEQYDRVRRTSPTRTSPGLGAARGRAPGSTPLPGQRRTRGGAPVEEIAGRETRRMQEEQARLERERDASRVESGSWASAPNTPENVRSTFLSVHTSASRGKSSSSASPPSPASGWETTPGGSRRPKTSRRVPNPSPTEFSDYIAGRTAPPLTAELAHRAGIQSPMALSTADGVLSLHGGGRGRGRGAEAEGKARDAPEGDSDVHAMVKGLLRRDDGIASLVSALASEIDAGGNSDDNAAIAERLLRTLTRFAARDSDGEAGGAATDDDDDDDDDDVSDGDNQVTEATSSASASELGGESGRGDALHQITAALLAEFSPPAYEPLVEGMDPWQQHEDDAPSASAPVDSHEHRERALSKVEARVRVAMRLSARDDDDPSSSALFLSAPLSTVLGAAVPPLVDGPLTRAVRATFEAWEKASARTAMEREHGRGEEEDADESEFGGGSDDDDEGRALQRMRRRHRRARFRHQQDQQSSEMTEAEVAAMLEVLVSALDDILTDELLFRSVIRSISVYHRGAPEALAAQALEKLCATRRRRLLAVATDPMGPSLLAARSQARGAYAAIGDEISASPTSSPASPHGARASSAPPRPPAASSSSAPPRTPLSVLGRPALRNDARAASIDALRRERKRVRSLYDYIGSSGPVTLKSIRDRVARGDVGAIGIALPLNGSAVARPTVEVLSRALPAMVRGWGMRAVGEESADASALDAAVAFEEFECVFAWLVHPSPGALGQALTMDSGASARMRTCVTSLRALFEEMGRERAQHVDFHLRTAVDGDGAAAGAPSGGEGGASDEPLLDADYIGLAELLRHTHDLRALGVVPPQLPGASGGDSAAVLAQRWSMACCEWDPQMRDWRSAIQHAEATHVAHSPAIQGGEMSWEEFSSMAAYCTPSEIAPLPDADASAPLDESVLLQSLNTFRQLRSDFAVRVAALSG